MTGKEFHSILSVVDQEGFDYAFRHYSDFADVQDSEFHRLRKAYVDAANDLRHYLGLEEE